MVDGSSLSGKSSDNPTALICVLNVLPGSVVGRSWTLCPVTPFAGFDKDHNTKLEFSVELYLEILFHKKA